MTGPGARDPLRPLTPLHRVHTQDERKPPEAENNQEHHAFVSVHVLIEVPQMDHLPIPDGRHLVQEVARLDFRSELPRPDGPTLGFEPVDLPEDVRKSVRPPHAMPCTDRRSHSRHVLAGLHLVSETCPRLTEQGRELSQVHGTGGGRQVVTPAMDIARKEVQTNVRQGPGPNGTAPDEERRRDLRVEPERAVRIRVGRGCQRDQACIESDITVAEA